MNGDSQNRAEVMASWVEVFPATEHFALYHLKVGVMPVASVTRRVKFSQVVKKVNEDGHESEEWAPEDKPRWYWSVCNAKRNEFEEEGMEDAMAMVEAVLRSDDIEALISGLLEERGMSLPARVMADRPVFGKDTRADFKKGRRISLEDGRK